MGIDGEPAKVLLPFLQRADEMQKHNHLVAYYCRLYGMEKGLKIPAKERTNYTTEFLISIMNQLEKDKMVVKLSPDDNLYMEGFALSVFAKADKQDRAGLSDLKTAQAFYAASTFFEVLLQFGPLQPDIQEKQKYATWKAADIRKAMAEGRKPIPGPPGGDKESSDGDDMFWNNEVDEVKSNDAPETLPPAPSTPNIDVSLGPTAMDTSTRSSLPSTPPEPSPQHSCSRSSEDINLPSAPSDTYLLPDGQNPYSSSNSTTYPSIATPSHLSNHYSHSSGTPFDSLGGNDNTPAPSTYTSYQYPPDAAGYTMTTPSSYCAYPSSMPQNGQGSLPQPDSSVHHQPQQHWPSSPYNEPTSTYPSDFTTASVGYHPTTPQYPSSQLHGATKHSGKPPTPPQANGSVHAPNLPGGLKSNEMYDSNYKSTPAQVAEAHKASRFAVSALAFDDVPTAIEHLRKSLQLLTSHSSTTE